jgi:uncharacterized damage-inducible protein DinB
MSASGTNIERHVYTVEPLEGCDPIVGTALWVMQDTRRRTLRELEGLPDEWLDKVPPMGNNTLGTILYHMALAESGWLYDVIQQTPPSEIQELLPQEGWDEQGILVKQEGNTLDTYLDRLKVVRERFLEVYKAMPVEEFRRLRDVPAWTGDIHHLTPERVLYHLVNHDAEHRGEIMMIVEHFRSLS